MTRRKGEMTPARIDREFLYQVQIDIPVGGRGDRINKMDAFCREHGFKVATRGIGKLRRLRTDWDATRYYFADPAHADAFRERFGGERTTIKARRSGVRS